MPAPFIRPDPSLEYFTLEGCHILEAWNVASDGTVSISRARVDPGVTTRQHRLRGVTERYVVIEGEGIATVGGVAAAVRPGDVVVIPAGVVQQIRNTGSGALVFYCVCTPRYTQECYEAL